MFKLVVLSCALAVAAAVPSGLGLGLGLGWHGGLAGHWGGAHLAGPVIAPLAAAHYAAPLAVAHGGVAAAPAIAAYNYRGPLSLAPGQPANIVAHDGRPLDTISVNLDRAAHITAKALDPAGGLHGHGLAHGHLLGKRSAPWAGAWSHAAVVGPAAHVGVPAHLGALHAAPLALHGAVGHVAPLGLGHVGHVGHVGHLGHVW